MTKNLDNDGLKSIVENYDIFYIDLWGVVHNGITLHKNAIEVLEEITKANKVFARISTPLIIAALASESNFITFAIFTFSFN